MILLPAHVCVEVIKTSLWILIVLGAVVTAQESLTLKAPEIKADPASIFLDEPRVDAKGPERPKGPSKDGSKCPDTYPSQLERLIKPLHYTITIKADLESLTFQGSEIIYFDINMETKEIVLNAFQIDVNKGIFVNEDGEKQTASEIRINEKNQTVTFLFNPPLDNAKTGLLKVEWKGEISSKLKGFYKSQGILLDGKTSLLAVTQFEPIFARKALPCIDEPDKKATFNINLIAQRADGSFEWGGDSSPGSCRRLEADNFCTVTEDVNLSCRLVHRWF